MKKGIAIIVPNADFSDAAIGKLTFPTEVIVKMYLNKVNASVSNTEKLVTLIDALKAQDVLDTLDVYPLLGDSVVNKCIPINSVYFNTLVVGENASNGAEGIDFTNTVAANITTYNTLNKGKFSEGYVFVSAKRNAAESLGQSVFVKYKPVGGLAANGFLGMSLFRGTTKVLNIMHTSGTPDTAIDCDGTFVNVSGSIQNSALKVITNGSEVYNGAFANEATDNWEMNNVIGADCLEPGSNYPDKSSFSGSIRMFAIGYVPSEKVLAVDAAFRAYFA